MHLKPGAKILVAVSGGPDSVALAHFLRGLPYRTVLGHVDHRLRRGSSQDARFVQKLAKMWDLPFALERVDVKRHAKKHQRGIEEAARELRYRALFLMAGKYRCGAILTAHTANDQAETILMNFLRGAGPAGLAGIPEMRLVDRRKTIRLIRPFLSVKKNQILEYLKRHKLDFRRDPTNESLQFSRNRMRHVTLPYLERQAPGLTDRLLQSADVFRQEERFWEARVAQKARETAWRNGKRFTVVLPKLLGYHNAVSRRILRHVLPGLSFQDIEQVFRLARSPRETEWLELPLWRVRREKNQLVAYQKRTG
jgi:tRNA(Ile)-lysidine synthase